MRKGGYALQYASAALQADREVVYTAVRQHDIKYRENGELIDDPNRIDIRRHRTDRRDDPAYTAAIIGTSAEGTSNTPPLRYTRILMCLLLCHVMLCNAYAALRYVSVELQVHRALDYLRERRLEDPLDQDPLDQDPLDEYPLCSVRHQE